MGTVAIRVEGVSVEYRLYSKMGLRGHLFGARSRPRVHGALRDVTFSVPRGQVLGVIGKNGAGKTTLLRVLAGIIKPDKGTCTVSGKVLPVIGLGLGFEAELSGLRNIRLAGLLLGLSRAEIEARLQSIIDFADIGDFIHEPLKTYSTGMRARLGFAIISHLDPDVLLIDEVLGAGDAGFRAKSSARIKEMVRSHQTTAVIVSHSLSMIRELCDQALWLDRGEVRALGDVNEVLVSYAGHRAG